jgi:porin
MKSIAFFASMTAAFVLAGNAHAQASPSPGSETDAPLPSTAAPPPEPVDAQSQPGPSVPPMTIGILGDWGGLRGRLYDRGLDFQLAYGNEFAWNPRGGSHKDATVIGQAIVGVTADMDKLTGIEGGTAKVALFYRHGPSLTVNADLGMLQQVQEAYGRGEIVRLVEAWYQQSFDGDRFRLKLGRMPANSEFASFSCDFQNLSFCASPQGNFNSGINYWFSAPGSNWAAVGRYNLGGDRKQGYLQVGAYLVDPDNVNPTKGFNLGFSGTKGVLLPFEAAWTPTFGGDKPGYYKVGGWVETSRANDLVRDRDGTLVAVSGNEGKPYRGRHGVYFEMVQQLTFSPEGLDGKGLSVFFNFTQLDRKTSLIDNQTSVGITQTGTFAGRSHDQIAFAVARTHINSRMRSTDRLAVEDGLLAGIRSSEYLAEFDYRIVPVAGVRITPNVQWGINPGGISQNRNVVALGVKTSVQF